jgi:hypothetical protein
MVEQHSRCDERTSETASPRLVGTCDEPVAERAIELE